MGIVNFFNNSKKRDLSYNSKSDGVEDPKKLREECLGSSEANAGGVFAEGLNNSSCRDILCNYLKELEAKVVKIYEVANSTKESQIKGEKQLEDLTSSVDYITTSMSTRKREKRKMSKLNVCKSVCPFWKTKMVK